MVTLVSMDADETKPSVKNSSTTAHPVLIAGDQDVATTDQQKGNKGRTKGTSNPSGLAPVPRMVGDTQPPTSCRLCTIVKNSHLASSTKFSDFSKQSFSDIHRPTQGQNSGLWYIRPDACLLWLQFSVQDRAKAMSDAGQGHLCNICLSIPGQWNTAKTACKSRHTLYKGFGLNRRQNQLCVSGSCPYHYSICTSHISENKKHPLLSYANRFLVDCQSLNIGFSSEVIMMVPAPTPSPVVDHESTSQALLALQTMFDNSFDDCSVVEVPLPSTNQAISIPANSSFSPNS